MKSVIESRLMCLKQGLQHSLLIHNKAQSGWMMSTGWRQLAVSLACPALNIGLCQRRENGLCRNGTCQ